MRIFVFSCILSIMFVPLDVLADDTSNPSQKVYTFGLIQQDVESNPIEDSIQHPSKTPNTQAHTLH